MQKKKANKLGKLNVTCHFHHSCVTCQMSPVTSHVLTVTFRMSPVICHNSLTSTAIALLYNMRQEIQKRCAEVFVGHKMFAHIRFVFILVYFLNILRPRIK